jgi:hypothetical protein
MEVTILDSRPRRRPNYLGNHYTPDCQRHIIGLLSVPGIHRDCQIGVNEGDSEVPVKDTQILFFFFEAKNALVGFPVCVRDF